jgi:hypothetical protein
MRNELDATYLGHSPKPQVKGWLIFVLSPGTVLFVGFGLLCLFASF